MRGEYWSPSETDRLRVFLSMGLRVQTIARRMGMSYERVRSKIRVMRKKKPKVKRINGGGHYGAREVSAQTWERKCLCCGMGFTARSPYLRLCERHRGGE